MAASFKTEIAWNRVHDRVDNKNVASAKVTRRIGPGVHAASAAVLVLFILVYTGFTAGTNYVHYTSWSFTLAAVYVASDFWLRSRTSAVLGPLAYAVTQSVACMTAAMYVAGSGLVREAYQKHDDNVVSLMNVVLHVLPALIVSTLFVLSRHDIVSPPNHTAKCTILTLAFLSAYFMTFSPRHQYEVIVSNTTIRASVVVLHVLFSVAAVAAVQQRPENNAP